MMYLFKGENTQLILDIEIPFRMNMYVEKTITISFKTQHIF